MQKTKVSIIIPVYNCEKFLQKCLDSIVNQTLQEIEIICINDGSTDNSGRILEEYNDKRIKIINKENGGQSSARNIGIDIAKGEYIGFVDSDDWVDLDFFEKLYSAAKKYDTDIAAGGIIRLHKFNKKYQLKFDKEIIASDFREKLLVCDVPDKSYVWNKIYRLNKIKQYNLKFIEGKIFEDVVFTPQVLYNLNTLVTVPDIYYYYWRRSGSTVTLRNKKAYLDGCWAKKEAEKFFEEHNINISGIKTTTKRYRLFGFSVFKVCIKGNTKTYRLFNIIKWNSKTSC